MAVLGHRHLVALLAEQVGQRVRERDLVLNDQDARHAVLSPRTVPASVRPSLGLDHARPVGRRGKGHREGRAAPLLAPDAHPAPVVGADVLDDRQAQAGAAGGARAGGVDPVEALEDALLLGRGDALALVGDGHLDRVLDPAGPDADPGAGLAVVDGVGHQVPDRGGEQLGIPEHPQPVLAGEGELDVARLGRHPHPVDRLGHDRPDVDELGLVEGVGHLQPRQVDDLLDQPGEPGGLDEDALREPLDRLGVVLGAEHGLGEQRDAADRGLQLVADVGDEVAADLLDPPGVGVVLGEDQHVRDRDRRDPHPHHHGCRRVRAAGQVELGLADHAVAAHLAREVAQLVVHQLAVAHQPVADRRRRGVDDGVARVDDHGDRAQHGQHVADARGAAGAPRARRGRRCARTTAWRRRPRPR